MLSALAINGTALHETTTRAVRSVEGLVGISAPRRSVRPRPQAHGSIDETRYLDEGIVSIAGDVWGSTQEAAYAELRVLNGVIMSSMGDSAAGMTLTWTEGVSGLSLQRTVRLAGPMLPPLIEGGARLTYSLILASCDPVSYSQTLTTATGSALATAGGGDLFPDTFTALGGDVFADSAAGTTMFTNAGNMETRPVLRIYGLVTAATVVCGTSRISLTGSIAAGDYLDIDLRSRKLTLWSGGVSSNAAALLVPGSTQWFALPANATTTLSLLAGTFDASARLDVIGRSAYM